MLYEIISLLKKEKVCKKLPFIFGGFVLFLLFISLFNEQFVYFAFIFGAFSVISIVWFSKTEKEILGFLLFLFLFARIFKIDKDGMSLYTLLEFLAIVHILLKYYFQKEVLNKKIITFAVLVFISAVLEVVSLSNKSAIIEVAKLIKNFVLLFMFVNAYKQNNAKYFILAFLFGFILSIIFGLFKQEIPRLYYLTGNLNVAWIDGEIYFRFSGLDPDPNYFSITLTIAYAICLIMFFSKQATYKILWFLLAVAFVVCGFFTYSKSFYLIIIVETLGLFLFRNNRKINVRFFIEGAIFIALLVGLIVVNPLNVFERIISRFTNHDLTTGRVGIWISYIDQIKEIPSKLLLGFGLGAPLVGERHAHNLYIEIIYNLGIVGTFLFATIYIFTMTTNKRKFRHGMISVVCFAVVLVQYAFLNGFSAFELPYYLMVLFIINNTDLAKGEDLFGSENLNRIKKRNVIKVLLAKNILTKKLYARLCKTKDKIIYKKKIKTIKRNGVKTVHKLQSLFSKSGVKFFFDMGTLLGIVREGKLLGHDIDVDVAVIEEEVEKREELSRFLQGNGCTIKYRYFTEETGVFEDSYTLSGIKFDVNYYSEIDGNSVCYLGYNDPKKQMSGNKMNMVQLRCSKISKIEQIDFFGSSINVPENAELYLAERYGENWRIPDKNYVYWKGPSTQQTPYLAKRINFLEKQNERNNDGRA